VIENRPVTNILTHAVLVLGVVLVVLPIWVTFVVSTHANEDVLTSPIPLWPGAYLLENYASALSGEALRGVPVGWMIFNSTVMALGIAVGKIAISIISAYAVVYFRFPGRPFFFWIIFLTLMLPVEVRILPTFEVTADLGMLNSYSGLIIPLIASATATFLFRQFFLTVPDELLEASRVDGAGPLRFFWDILLPLSRTNIAALFVILFIYGWNQYLWPLLITTDEGFYTIVMGLGRLVNTGEFEPRWPLIMSVAMLAMLPPVIVVIAMQRLFVKGLVETEK
jgi:sn-glycerol 3-phosphate transport system permease protein